MNVIAITFYDKPELLYLYLEQLEKSGELQKYKLRLHTEQGYHEEEDYVINDFKQRNPDVDTKVYVKKKVNCPMAGFYNILTSYLISAEESSDFVIIGEEDMLPTEDYLTFNRQCYDQFLSKYDRIFCVAHKRRPEAEIVGNPESVIGDYQLTSPSCISVDAIKKYLFPYMSDKMYFENPILFNNIHFNNLRIAYYDHTHHDGALERIMLANNLFAIKPDQTRSMHVGLSGIFCKGQPPQGTFDERIVQWRELIKDGDRLRSLSTMPHDMVVTDPKGPEWSELFLDTDRSKSTSQWFYDPDNIFKEYIDENNSGW